jgi:hypothetical protein
VEGIVQTPLRFPTDAEVNAEEAARFRVLSAEERIASIRSVLSAGDLLIRRSSQKDFLESHRQSQEDLARRAIQEFVGRHAERS